MSTHNVHGPILLVVNHNSSVFCEGSQAHSKEAERKETQSIRGSIMALYFPYLSSNGLAWLKMAVKSAAKSAVKCLNS